MALFLCATMHQGDERFSVQTRGKQCSFMSLAAVITAPSIQDGGCYFLSSRNLNCSKQIFSTLQEDNSKINVNSSSYSTVRFSCGLVLQECLSRTANFELQSSSKMSDKIEALIKKISKQPRNDIVAELIRKGDIDSLTQFRLKLVEKGKQFETFPKGDPYTRRKPEGRSKFSTLEERLANDICVIYEYFNTGVVTMELKDMFKNENRLSNLSVVSESGVVNTIVVTLKQVWRNHSVKLSQVKRMVCQHLVKRGNVGSRETLHNV